MRLQLFAQLALGLAIALTVSAMPNQPSNAQSTTFYCGTSNGVAATIARTPRGNLPVIRWSSDYFSGSGWNQQRRCQEVSSRFQSYYDNGTLKYITTGRMNKQSVVCVASRKGGDCTGLLFTLKPGSAPDRTLSRLLNYRALAAGGSLNESAGERLYIDMKEFMNTAPVAGESSDKPVSESSGSLLWDSK
ncbi:MAG: COP23 domain-containing protein [Spirirestis rafaelensis WJT71-NPBG6]|jgi:hypothetical protein|nr:COP23 domain-containing protein [Spirirestis rafaelensis WJT71-NPBG6]